MTVYCIVCTKEPLPGNNSRSFHKCSATNYTRVCSDHFDKNAFVDFDTYIQRRRLLRNAVPCRLVNTNKASTSSVIESTKDHPTQLFSDQETFNEPTSIDNHKNVKRSLPLRDITDVSPNKRLHSHNECDSAVVKKVCKEPQPNTMHVNLKRSSPGVDKSDASPSKKLCFSNQLDSSGKDASVSVEPKKDHAALKRSQPSSIDISNIPPSKKIRFYDGSQPMQLSRKILPPSVFNDGKHILEQEPLYDHHQQLIYLVIQNCVHKRLKHESDEVNDLKSRIRMFYNKITIFKGQ